MGTWPLFLTQDSHNPALGHVTQIIILNGQLTLLYAQVHDKTLHLFFYKTFFKTQTQDSMKISTVRFVISSSSSSSRTTPVESILVNHCLLGKWNLTPPRCVLLLERINRPSGAAAASRPPSRHCWHISTTSHSFVAAKGRNILCYLTEAV